MDLDKTSKRIRIIRPPGDDFKTSSYDRQPVIDKDIKKDFIALKKEHGEYIRPEILQDHFKGREKDFQRFLINELNGVFNDQGVDGKIGPSTAEDASRINYINDMSIIEPELGRYIRDRINLDGARSISRDTDKNRSFKTPPPLALNNKPEPPSAFVKKKSPIKSYKKKS